MLDEYNQVKPCITGDHLASCKEFDCNKYLNVTNPIACNGHMYVMENGTVHLEVMRTSNTSAAKELFVKKCTNAKTQI